MAVSAAVLSSLLSSGASLGSGLLNWKHDFDVMDYQYRLQSPQQRMADMVAAGINPNAAASGISGSSLPVGGHATPMPDIGSTLNSAASNLIQQQLIPSEIRKNNAAAEGQEIDNEIKSDTKDDSKEIIRETARKWKADRRTSEANATVAEAYAEYAGDNALNDALIKQQQYSNLSKEYDKLEKEISKIAKDIELEDSEISKNSAQVELMAEQKNTEKAKQSHLYSSARREAADAKKQEMRNDFWLKHGYDSDNPMDVAVRNATENGHPEEAERILDDCVSFQKDVADAQETGRERAYNRENPIAASKKELTDQYNADKARLESRISVLKNEIHEYNTGRRKDNYFKSERSTRETELRRLQGELKNLRKEYQKNLRRFDSNTSRSYGAATVKYSESD